MSNLAPWSCATTGAGGVASRMARSSLAGPTPSRGRARAAIQPVETEEPVDERGVDRLATKQHAEVDRSDEALGKQCRVDRVVHLTGDLCLLEPCDRRSETLVPEGTPARHEPRALGGVPNGGQEQRVTRGTRHAASDGQQEVSEVCRHVSGVGHRDERIGLAEHGVTEQVGLGRPPAVDGALVDAGAAGDGVHGERAVADLGHEGGGRIEDGVAHARASPARSDPMFRDRHTIATRVAFVATADTVLVATRTDVGGMRVSTEDVNHARSVRSTRWPAKPATRQSEPSWEALVRHAADVVAVLDGEGRLRYANEALARLLGYEADSVLGHSVLDYVHPEDLDRAAAAFAGALGGAGLVVPLTVRLRSKSGAWRHVEAIGNNRVADPTIGGIVVNARDVTEHRAMELFFVDGLAALEAIVGDEPVDDIMRSLAAMITNQGIATEAGIELWHPELRCIPEPVEAAEGLRERPIRVEGDEIGVLRYVQTDEHAETGQQRFVVGSACWLASLAVQRQLANARLAHLALHDAMTGVANQAYFRERLLHVVADGAAAGLVLVDVDHLELINEARGRDVGDAVLAALAARLADLLPRGSTIARTGDDEFALLVEHPADEVVVGRLASDALALARQPIHVTGADLHATISVGVMIATGNESASEVLADAEGALRQAKQEGRNRVAVADSARRRAITQRLTCEQDLRTGIPRGELRAHLQPILDLADGTLVGAELLARWEHPTRGLLHPGEFVAMAEESDLIEEIGRWALDQACAYLADPERAAPTVAVNTSPRDLGTPRFADQIGGVLARHNVHADRLVIELTETAAIQPGHVALENMRAIRALGARIHLDDFGTGHSSLGRLQSLAIDALKIDRSFVSELTRDRAGTAIVSAIVTLCEALDITTIAEGVETPNQDEALRVLGVKQVQGFHYGRPLPVAAFDTWWGTRSRPQPQ